jgi:hypothetical protein
VPWSSSLSHLWSLSRPDLVISMAGYNSCVEAAVGGVPTVVAPRVDEQDQEQAIRARLFAQWCPWMRVARCEAPSLAAAGLAALERAERLPGRPWRLSDGLLAEDTDVAAAVLGADWARAGQPDPAARALLSARRRSG